MTPARHHAEWLSLVESSGPFLSMPVLLRVFPQGLDLRDATRAAALRENYEDWLERGRPLLHVHTAWIRHVLENLLEWPADFIAEGQSIPAGMEASQPHFGETLRPDLVLRRPPGTADADTTPQLLVVTYPPAQDLEKPVAGKIWKASPATRMTELLHASGVPLGLVTNGEHWMVVYAPRGETSGFASWYADLWMQEPVTLRAFHSLLCLRRFFGVAAGETLAALYAESAKDQQEVTEQLGRQVRRAVEMLVQAIDQIDADSNRALLANVPEKEVYDAVLTVMMRLVFLFSSEERGLLLLGDPLFDQHYAVSTLRELLRERADQHGEEVLERRHDAWSRLLATFRAVHGGVQHEAMRLPAYGGSLFDPDRYPFLEGRETGSRWRETQAHPLPVNNRVVLHLLEALQLLRVKVPGGGPAEARRVSFRALDIEQIGHVYEGLLDHTARRATEVTLGLSGKNEPEISLAKLEALAGITPGAAGRESDPLGGGLMAAETIDSLPIPFPAGKVRYDEAPAVPPALIDFLKDATGRSANALETSLGFGKPKARGKSKAADSSGPAASSSTIFDPLSTISDHSLLLACGQDPRLAQRIRPFAGLLRSDDFGRLAVIRPGSVFVTAGTDRRSSGTHYTPRSLTEPIVQHTLDPLVYIGPAEGLPAAEWKLKSPKEILALKVCDLAMGSGAFLVQACRYLAERLCEAWEMSEKELREASSSTINDPPSTAERSETDCRRQPAGRGWQASSIHSLLIVTPDGSLSTGHAAERLLPTDPAERVALARRYVADRCLYGVDINLMAVEMAKLSLWLITLQKDRPFTFLDHAFKWGDSLLGVTSVKEIANFSLRVKPGGTVQDTFATANLFRYVDEASAKRRALEELPSNDHSQIATKNRLHAEAEAATAKVKAVADCLIAFELRGLDGKAYEDKRTAEAENVQLLMKRDADASLNSQTPTISQLTSHAREQLRGRRPFHWAIEFPEVSVRGGFDALVSNPPFIGNKYWPERLPEGFSLWVRILLGKKAGKADVVAVFLRRAYALLSAKASAGMLSTTTAREGDTLELGLAPIAQQGRIYRAVSSLEWPGTAGVYVCAVWFSKESTQISANLDEREVTEIGPSLVEATPHKEVFLLASAPWGFIGCDNGGGEILILRRGNSWLEKLEIARSPFLRIYLTGDDIATGRYKQPERWVVDCGDGQLSDVTIACRVTGEFLRSIVQPARKPEDFETHPGLISRWWQMWNPRATQYRRLRQKPSCLAIPVVAKFVSVVELPTNITFTNKICVLEKPEPNHHVVLLSSLFEAWVIERGGTMGASTITIALTKCIQTFPFHSTPLADAGNLLSNWNKLLADCAGRIGYGYTPIFNAVHDRGEQSADIVRLRALHMEMDQAVAAAYGWSDLDLGHGFHATKQGERYTLSESARREVLDRLLALNHQRHAEELTAGLHEKKSKAKNPATKRATKNTKGYEPQPDLFPPVQPDLFG